MIADKMKILNLNFENNIQNAILKIQIAQAISIQNNITQDITLSNKESTT